MNKRIEQKLQSEQKILDVALKEFATRGYERTRLQDIAKEADVAIGLIGAKFTNKMGLYERIVDDGCMYLRNLNNTLKCDNWKDLCNQLLDFLKQQNEASEQIKTALLFVYTMANSSDTPDYYLNKTVTEIDDSIMYNLFKEGQDKGEIVDGDIYEIYRLFFRNAISVMQICNSKNIQLPSNEWFIGVIKK